MAFRNLGCLEKELWSFDNFFFGLWAEGEYAVFRARGPKTKSFEGVKHRNIWESLPLTPSPFFFLNFSCISFFSFFSFFLLVET